MRRQPVDLVVGRHDELRIAALDRGDERWKEHITQDALRDVRGRGVRATFGLAVPGHVLERREHTILCKRHAAALEAPHGCDTQLARQIRIFTIRFFEATPARIACDVHDRCEHELRAASANLARGHREHAFDQRGIPGARKADGLRKAGRIARGVSVQPFFVK